MRATQRGSPFVENFAIKALPRAAVVKVRAILVDGPMFFAMYALVVPPTMRFVLASRHNPKTDVEEFNTVARCAVPLELY
jgi:hypothetical protein